MGMYTEVIFRGTISKSKVGNDIFDIFDYMFNPNSRVDINSLKLPDHEFFKCQRWSSIGNMSSFYHHPNRVVDWYIPYYNLPIENNTDVYIFSRNDLKNYNGEIDKFFDWVQTLGIFHDGEYMGQSMYEEYNTPKIYIQGEV